MVAFLLIHSPLGAPYTWEPVAHALTEMGARCSVPTLSLEPDDEGRYWPRHVDELVRSARSFGSSAVLTAHSGAGPLVPEVASRLGDGAAGYALVDAAFPRPGMSRLRGFPNEDEAAAFRARAVEGMVPPFPEDLLAKLIEDEDERTAYIDSQRPMPLAIYEEALPTTELTSLPGAYLQFSPAYNDEAAAARGIGWRYRHMPGSHFHLLDHPREVAAALLGWFG